MNEPKFYVEVKTAQEAFKADKQKLSQVKNVVRGKFIREVQKQYVSCPVFKRDISFVDCFNCQNFLRRIKGQVHCKGVDGVRDPMLPLLSGESPELPSSTSISLNQLLASELTAVLPSTSSCPSGIF